MALAAHPKPAEGSDIAAAARAQAVEAIRAVFTGEAELMEQMPGVGDLIEFSRSIHAEMNAILNAARGGAVPIGCTLYCTTFPCLLRVSGLACTRTIS
jgi:deoxycytidylate deaminase